MTARPAYGFEPVYAVGARRAFAVTPDNSNDLSEATRALYIGVAGDVKVDMVEFGTAITFKNCPTGMVLPIEVSRVYATGTTATNIVALA